MEDNIAISSGRADVLAAALTLASSIVRLENPNNGSGKVHLASLRYDLGAAKAHTLFVKPAEQRLTQDETASTPDIPTNSVQNTPPHLTKGEFQRLVVGKSMSEIRATLGRPSNTNEDSDGVTWYYWSNDVQVEDPDAGTTVDSSAITFDPVTKTAIGVHF